MYKTLLSLTLLFGHFISFEQIKSGVICYEERVTLNIKSIEKTDTKTTISTEFLKLMIDGRTISVFHKVLFYDSASKIYQSDAANISPENTYIEMGETIIRMRNTKLEKEKEYNFDLKTKKANLTSEKILREVSYKYTGKQKKISNFDCQEIEYVDYSEGKPIKVNAFVTKNLPKSAGFEVFKNLDAAIIEMSTNGRTLRIKSFNADPKGFNSVLLKP